MGNKERARAWRRAQKPWLPKSWTEYRERENRSDHTEWFSWLCRLAPQPANVFNKWRCGQDIRAGQIVYGISRIFVAQPGAAISRYVRGVAASDGRKGKTIKVQACGMATIPVEGK